VTIEISGCADRASAMAIAKTVANSPLVKTAIHGADPNWGRIVSAAGYAGVPLDPRALRCTSTATCSIAMERRCHSTPRRFRNPSAPAATRLCNWPSARARPAVRFWTADLTAEYVRLNADYHT